MLLIMNRLYGLGKQLMDVFCSENCPWRQSGGILSCLQKPWFHQTDVTGHCENVVCENGGKCVEGITKHICDCPRGFSGKYCDGESPVVVIEQVLLFHEYFASSLFFILHVWDFSGLFLIVFCSSFNFHIILYSIESNLLLSFFAILLHKAL